MERRCIQDVIFVSLVKIDKKVKQNDTKHSRKKVKNFVLSNDFAHSIIFLGQNHHHHRIIQFFEVFLFVLEFVRVCVCACVCIYECMYVKLSRQTNIIKQKCFIVTQFLLKCKKGSIIFWVTMTKNLKLLKYDEHNKKKLTFPYLH